MLAAPHFRPFLVLKIPAGDSDYVDWRSTSILAFVLMLVSLVRYAQAGGSPVGHPTPVGHPNEAAHSSLREEQRSDEPPPTQPRIEARKSDAPCGFTAAAYRKRLAVVYVPLAQPGQIGVNDYYGYEQGIPVELARRLVASGAFLARVATDVALYPDPNQAPLLTAMTPNGRPALIQLAEQWGIQFVVSGVVRDVGVEVDVGLVPSLFGASPAPQARRLELEFFVHDALSSELLGRHHYARTLIDGPLVPRRPLRIDSQVFFHSPFGRLLDQVLDAEVTALRTLLRCRPFVMKVLEQKGGRLYLDAGAETLVHPGDVVTIYESDQVGRVFGAAGRMEQFGSPKAAIRVLQVFPAYALAEPERPAPGVTFIPGDFLRAW